MRAAELVEVTLPNNDIMYVEIDASTEGDIAWRRGRKVAWEDFRDQVSKVSRWVIESVRSGLPDTPTSVAVEFGMKLSGETGTLVGALAKASTEATIVVRLEWNSKQVSAG
jgi:hypothetical protein